MQDDAKARSITEEHKTKRGWSHRHPVLGMITLTSPNLPPAVHQMQVGDRGQLCLPLSNLFWIFFHWWASLQSLAQAFWKGNTLSPSDPFFLPSPLTPSCVVAFPAVLSELQSIHPVLVGRRCSADQHNVLDTARSPNYMFVNGALVRGFLSHYHWSVEWRPVQTAAWWVTLFFPMQLA